MHLPPPPQEPPTPGRLPSVHLTAVAAAVTRAPEEAWRCNERVRPPPARLLGPRWELILAVVGCQEVTGGVGGAPPVACSGSASVPALLLVPLALNRPGRRLVWMQVEENLSAKRAFFSPETSLLLPSLDRRRSAVRKHVIPGCDVPLMQLWCNTNSLSVKNRLLPNREAVSWSTLPPPTASKHANANELPTSTRLHNRPPAGGTIHHLMYYVSIAAGTDPPGGGTKPAALAIR